MLAAGEAASNGTRPQNGGIAAANGTSGKAVLNGSSAVAAGEATGRPSTYFGHDREEVTRIMIQTLSDMGYQNAAKSVSQESGFELESPTVAAFRDAVLGGAWPEAEQLLSGAALATDDEQPTPPGNGLVLSPGSDISIMRFWVRQQKFLELLEQRETSRALTVLRTELTPLHRDTNKLHFLSSLLMCRSAEELKSKAQWDGADGESRSLLLSTLSRCISPSVMLPEHRLAILLQQVKKSQIDACVCHTVASSPSLYADHACERNQFPCEVAMTLPDVGGEVWGLQFSHDGRRLAAWGSNEYVIIWDVPAFRVIRTLGDHGEGVANISWSPDDSMIVTCARDKYARIWDTKTGSLLKKLDRFAEPASGCVWAPNGQTFVTSSLDKDRSLRTWSVDGELLHDWEKKHRVQDLCGDGRWIVAVDDINTIHVYHAGTRELAFDMPQESRPTSVSLSEDSHHLLVNRKDGEARLINLLTQSTVQKYLGHKGGDCLIRSSLGGANESFALSGSEDGNIFIWHKISGRVVAQMEAHEPRTNAVVWNPEDTCMIASCGDDGEVKIWSNKSHAAAIRAFSEQQHQR
ncbi:WD domain-containing protein [Plectosphaerella plurivora]|uniref:WD domain-containing protein n=1 Tax=Plectosphaerella plurivora TaxID=936078 RepID=A0A9P8VKD8_9PEZI|nr:WD domain-containing protein [Plectosphaerella plurivora]